MLVTTLNKIREQKPCAEGWEKLLRYLGKTQADDEPLAFASILDSNGLDDAIWCCRSAPEYSKEWWLFAVRCARAVQYLMKDPRSIAALDVVERFARGKATGDELRTARDAARDARDAAWAAEWAAADAATDAAADAAAAAAWAAADAAAAAAWAADAAWAATDAWAAAWAAARAAAGAAAGDAARDAARAAREQQVQDFLDLCNGTAEWAKEQLIEFSGFLMLDN